MGHDFVWVGRRISHNWLMFLVNFRGDKQMIAIKMHMKREKKGMSVVAELLLNLIVSYGKGVSIMELVEQAHNINVSSQATSHRALKWLMDNKYIKVEFIKDNRTKYLFGTARGYKFVGAVT